MLRISTGLVLTLVLIGVASTTIVPLKRANKAYYSKADTKAPTKKAMTKEGIQKSINRARNMIKDFEGRVSLWNKIIASNNSYQGASVRLSETNLGRIKDLTSAELDVDRSVATLDHLESELKEGGVGGSAWMRNQIISDIQSKMKKLLRSADKVVLYKNPPSQPPPIKDTSRPEVDYLVNDSEEGVEYSTAAAGNSSLEGIDWALVHRAVKEEATKATSQSMIKPGITLEALPAANQSQGVTESNEAKKATGQSKAKVTSEANQSQGINETNVTATESPASSSSEQGDLSSESNEANQSQGITESIATATLSPASSRNEQGRNTTNHRYHWITGDLTTAPITDVEICVMVVVVLISMILGPYIIYKCCHPISIPRGRPTIRLPRFLAQAPTGQRILWHPLDNPFNVLRETSAPSEAPPSTL